MAYPLMSSLQCWKWDPFEDPRWKSSDYGALPFDPKGT